MKHTLIIILAITAALNCSVEYAQGQSYYPEFSWEKLPLHLFMRKAEKYTQQELEYISAFPIVTLAQTTGMESYGSTEQGVLEAAKAIKVIYPKIKLLYYRNTMVHYAFYDADTALSSITKPFLEDSLGNTNLHVGLRPLYDLSNDSVQRWWANHAVQMSTYEEIDGVFFDGVGKVISSYLLPLVGEAKRLEVLKGYNAMMDDCQSRMVSTKIKVANLLRPNFPSQGLDYIHHFDGSYLEHFDGDVDWTAMSIETAQVAARSGKIICMTFDMGDEFSDVTEITTHNGYVVADDKLQKRFDYCLALFLVCAEKYSYFYFHDGYSVNEWSNNRLWLKRFSEYDKPLGAPIGKAVKVGNTYTREFEHAKVTLDIAEQKGEVLWLTPTTMSEVGFNHKSFRCYPIPASNYLMIESKKEMLNVSAFDLEGRILLTQKISGRSYRFELSQDLRKMAFLKIRFEDRTIETKRVISLVS